MNINTQKLIDCIDSKQYNSTSISNYVTQLLSQSPSPKISYDSRFQLLGSASPINSCPHLVKTIFYTFVTGESCQVDCADCHIQCRLQKLATGRKYRLEGYCDGCKGHVMWSERPNKDLKQNPKNQEKFRAACSLARCIREKIASSLQPPHSKEEITSSEAIDARDISVFPQSNQNSHGQVKDRLSCQSDLETPSNVNLGQKTEMNQKTKVRKLDTPELLVQKASVLIFLIDCEKGETDSVRRHVSKELQLEKIVTSKGNTAFIPGVYNCSRADIAPLITFSESNDQRFVDLKGKFAPQREMSQSVFYYYIRQKRSQNQNLNCEIWTEVELHGKKFTTNKEVNDNLLSKKTRFVISKEDIFCRCVHQEESPARSHLSNFSVISLPFDDHGTFAKKISDLIIFHENLRDKYKDPPTVSNNFLRTEDSNGYQFLGLLAKNEIEVVMIYPGCLFFEFKALPLNLAKILMLLEHDPSIKVVSRAHVVNHWRSVWNDLTTEKKEFIDAFFYGIGRSTQDQSHYLMRLNEAKTIVNDVICTKSINDSAFITRFKNLLSYEDQYVDGLKEFQTQINSLLQQNILVGTQRRLLSKVSRESPPSNEVSRENPPSNEVSREKPPSNEVSREKPPSNEASREKPPTNETEETFPSSQYQDWLLPPPLPSSAIFHTDCKQCAIFFRTKPSEDVSENI